MALEKTLYVAHVTVKGGRDGEAVSDDGNLNVKLTMPKALGGTGGNATNPEQLFAAGYGACFLSALNLVAGKKKLQISKDASVNATVALGSKGEKLGLEATLQVKLPGMAENEARELVALAHEVCPYSNATRNNIDVHLDVSVN